MYQTRSLTENPPDWSNLNANTKANLYIIAKDLNIILPVNASRTQLINLIKQKISPKPSPYKSPKMAIRQSQPINDDDEEERLVPEIIESDDNDEKAKNEEEEEEEDKPEDQMRFNIYSNNNYYSSDNDLPPIDIEEPKNEETKQSQSSYSTRESTPIISITRSAMISSREVSPIIVSRKTTPPIQASNNSMPAAENEPIKTAQVTERKVNYNVENKTNASTKTSTKKKSIFTTIIILMVLIVILDKITDEIIVRSEYLIQSRKHQKENQDKEAFTYLSKHLHRCSKDELLALFPNLYYDDFKNNYNIFEEKDGTLSIVHNKGTIERFFIWGDKHQALAGSIILLLVVLIYFVIHLFAIY